MFNHHVLFRTTLANTFALTAIVFSLLATTKHAHAFDMQGAEIEVRINLPDDSGNLSATSIATAEEIEKFFNKASCECTSSEFQVTFILNSLTEGAAVPTFTDQQDVTMFMGTDCATANLNDRNNCIPVTSENSYDISELRGGVSLLVSTREFIRARDMDCPTTNVQRNIFAIIDENGDGNWDAAGTTDQIFSITDETTGTESAISVDPVPPDLPTNVETSPGESAISLNWDNGNNTGIEFFQALCERADGTEQGFGAVPRYSVATTSSECGASPERAFTLQGDTTDTSDALKNLDSRAICGETSGTSDSLRIEGLENNVPYRIILVSVDESGNASGMDLGEASPTPSTDAWEYYLEAGGNADGEYCFVATAAYGDYDHPWVLVLRDFRDGTLAHFSLGQSFIDWYYTHGPTLANYIAPSGAKRGVARVLLAPLVAGATMWQYSSTFAKSLWLLMFGLLFCLRKTQKNNARRA